MMKFLTHIILEETSNIKRHNEPVTLGLPFPTGVVHDPQKIRLTDQSGNDIPLQQQSLARWADGSHKWILFDFQATLAAGAKAALQLFYGDFELKNEGNEISISDRQNQIIINTGEAEFLINAKIYKPFDQVRIKQHDRLDSSSNKVILLDASNIENIPEIETIGVETRGALRTTIKIEGKFKSHQNSTIANFSSRLHFYANHSYIRIDFTILNPNAAKHLGGLWDLGDPGSIYFKDLSIYMAGLSVPNYEIKYSTAHDVPIKSIEQTNCRIYQDSSGGENWRSKNHVNRFGVVKTSFPGYKIYCDDVEIDQGRRINPVLMLSSNDVKIAGAIQHFWQNFPKAIEIEKNTVILRLFPKYFDDVFELQGGEQKTHIVYFDFHQSEEDDDFLNWVDDPLFSRANPEYYSLTGFINNFRPEKTEVNQEILNMINVAIKGNNTFFNRREIIDEYGWRNFGEFYADHETVNQPREELFVSHYNNQYDGIWGCLAQFLRSGEGEWFTLANQLCRHVKDIDIYHTDADRIEYSHGIFWHTEHYIDAATASHRCFSRDHLKHRNGENYGGGPSPSHNYVSGLVLHYFLTGDESSKDAALELTQYILNNIENEFSIKQKIKTVMKKVLNLFDDFNKRNELVKINKVYSFNGPGRASGNALNTLLEAFLLCNDEHYLDRAEKLIRKCVHPKDEIDKRELLDTENRWMYTVFLQALGKYLHVKNEHQQIDEMYDYGKKVLLHYANWMVRHEYPYLERPEKLEYPNETWAAQDLRKMHILMTALKYSNGVMKDELLKKADYFSNSVIAQLKSFATSSLTRPIVLLLQNWSVH